MGVPLRHRRVVPRDEPWIVDSALALFVVVIALAQQSASVAATSETQTLGMAFAALFPLLLVLRRRAPVAVMAGLLVILAVWGATGAATSGAGIPVVVALYTVAAYRPSRVSLAVALVTAVWVLGVQAQSARVTSNVVEIAATFAATWWLGRSTQTRRYQRDALAVYAADLAATREQLAEQRVSEERLRIAREMHDVVAHSLGVVAVQAGVAEHLLERDPGQARESVTTIGDVARSGLADMRRTLDLLRSDGSAGDYDASPRLADVPVLVDDMRRGAQLDIDLQVRGKPMTPFDAALELAAYRVVQEALTNAGKHAPGSHVTVDLTYGPDDVSVEVVDDGSDQPLDVPGSGNGLPGMRERVALFGGSFEAASRGDGGFRVAASFPVGGGQR
jgi:signal transduction histidine kinase